MKVITLVRKKGSLLGICFFLVAVAPAGQGTRNHSYFLNDKATDTSSYSKVRTHRAKTLETNVDLVLVPVTVTDRRERLVLGLRKDNFSVYEGAQQQTIRYFSTEDAPISIGILFDASGSMYQSIGKARDALIQFLRRTNTSDEFFLIKFADHPQLLTGFTNSVEDIQNAMSTTTPSGSTALLDAVYLGLNKMKDARNERKVLLIVSDGGENHSRYNAREVLSILREADVQVYAIGLFEGGRTIAERRGPDLLAALTDSTGGRTLPVRRPREFGNALTILSTELHSQYMLAFQPNPPAHDGKWHRFSVRVEPSHNPSRLRIHAKTGYYAAQE